MERLERVIVLDFKGETKTHKERLAQNHRVRRRLDAMQGGAKKLVRWPVCLFRSGAVLTPQLAQPRA